MSVFPDFRLYMFTIWARLLVLGVGLFACAFFSPMRPISSPQTAASSDTTLVPEGFDLQGHRGARGLAPENTLPAFRHALELGIPTLEMDVVISGDGEVVVSHEPWMNPDICLTPEGERIPKGEGRQHSLFDMSYDEIAAYDCGSLQSSQFPEQHSQSASKPRLQEVLQEAEAYVRDHERSSVFYNIEMKSRPAWEGRFHPDPDVFAERVLAVVQEANVEARTTLQSFDPRTLEAASRRSDRIRIALLVNWMDNRGLATNLERLSISPDIYSPDVRLVDESLIAAAHDRGMKVIPWTVNERTTMKRLIRLGADGLITDYPDRGLEVLRSLDRW